MYMFDTNKGIQKQCANSSFLLIYTNDSSLINLQRGLVHNYPDSVGNYVDIPSNIR